MSRHPFDPDDAPSRAELAADELADVLGGESPVIDELGYSPTELIPGGDPPRCLYGLERDLLTRAELALKVTPRSSRGALGDAGNAYLVLYREDTLALVHALDRLGLLRLRRLLDLGVREEDRLDEADG